PNNRGDLTLLVESRGNQHNGARLVHSPMVRLSKVSPHCSQRQASPWIGDRPTPQRQTQPRCFAGTPFTSAWAGILRVTTAPAATMEQAPIVTPARITERAPRLAPCSTRVVANQLSGSR